jgi:hypothetical protein
LLVDVLAGRTYAAQNVWRVLLFCSLLALDPAGSCCGQIAEPGSREFTYLLLGGTRFVYASAVRLGLIQFVGSMSASKVCTQYVV